MFDDEFDDWDPHHPVDVDACEMTGDPQLDQLGYQSPRRVPRTWAHLESGDRDWLAQAKADRQQREQRRRAAVRQNLAETQQRVAERRGEPQPVRRMSQPDLPPHVTRAVEQGAPGRPAGWYRVDIAPDGSARWMKVDQPGDGPWITANTPPQPQWYPVEMTKPSPGTRIW